MVLPEPVNKKPNALLNIYAGFIPQSGLGLGNIGVGDGDIARLHGLSVENGLLSKGGFDEFDETVEPDGLGFAEVEDFEAEFALGAGHDSVENVGDVGVVAGGGAVAKNRDGFSGGDEPGEFVDGEVGALARAVHREETEHDDIEAVNVVIDVAEGFAGKLAGGVGRNGVENGVALGKRDFGVDAVNGGGGSEGDLFDAVEAGGFEEVDGAFDIDALVEGGIGEAGPDAGAGGEVDDLVKLDAAEQFVHGGAVRDVAVKKLEGFGQGLEFGEIALLEFGVVEIVEVVQRPDGMAGVQQALANVRANEAGAAGHEEIHRERLAKWAARCRVWARFDNPKLTCYKRLGRNRSVVFLRIV